MSQIPSHDQDHGYYDPIGQGPNGSKSHRTPFSVLRKPVPALTSADSTVPHFGLMMAGPNDTASISQHSTKTTPPLESAYEESWNDRTTISYEVEQVNTNSGEENQGE